MAVGTLTTVPVRAPTQVTRRTAGAAMLLAPVAGLLLAVPAGVVLWAALALGLGSVVAAALAVAALRLGDRALHLDGLADTADGLAASYDRERALAVMRTGDVGPAGAVALVLALLVQVGAAARLAELTVGADGPAAAAGALDGGTVGAAVTVMAGVVVSRAMLAVACLRGVPSARPDGLGAAMAGSVRWAAALVMLTAVAGVLAGVLAVLPDAAPWWSAPSAVAAAVLVTAVVLRRCVRRIGGMTGDVLGAVVEVSLAAALVAFAAAAAS
ncbi:adenosylcobinamide-GDP ribazoletransferase [Phytoactinopolyspora halotolerans]|uniref:Adenosylcobinamide-GDP ribazoletransferase n=1 Tax=Phytoactinopolyspora halotolerans TaxID=1981512 RepID=A0A6L9S0D1_9ACTN|nr:adenosylcobinamide-GDP ribazoletransferase [Phytoactinopolyspora halotolerans]